MSLQQNIQDKRLNGASDFRRRHGEGKSCGGGPSSIFSYDGPHNSSSYAHRTHVSAPLCTSLRGKAVTRGPCNGALHCNTCGDGAMSAPSKLPTSREAWSVATTTFEQGRRHAECSETNLAQVERSLSHGPQSQSHSHVASARICNSNCSAVYNKAGGKQHAHLPPTGCNEESSRDDSDSGGSSFSGHRRHGEGKSCGGGPTSISFGDDSASLIAPVLRDKCGNSKASVNLPTWRPPSASLSTPASEQYVPRDKQVCDGAVTYPDHVMTSCERPIASCARTDATCPSKVASAANSTVNQSGRVSYSDLAFENERLQAELNRAHAELAIYHRWFDGLAHNTAEAKLASNWVSSQWHEL